MIVEDRRIVTVTEACALARVSRRTIFYWAEKGWIDAIRVASGNMRIYEDSLFREKNYKRRRRTE